MTHIYNVLSKVMLVAVSAIALFSSCEREKRYADYVEAENKLMDKYEKVSNIVVVSSKPERQEGEWLDASGRKIYYETPSGLLYHQIALGDTTAVKPRVSSIMYVRYDGYDLYDNLIYSWSEKYAPSPDYFVLLEKSSEDNTYGIGFQEAASYLYKGGECSAIISFKIGNGFNATINKKSSSDYESHRPMRYEIKVVHVD